MNNENTMNIFDESFIKNFDFSNDFSTFNNETNLDEEDDIIINNDNKFSFDESKLDDFKIGDLLTEDSDDLSDFEPVKINSFTKDNSTNLDSFFDSIYNGVEDANDLISQINLKKKTLFETEKEINSLKDQIAREKEEFSRYMELQRQALEIEKKQLKEKAELQKLRLSEEASQFKNDMEVKNNELELREQKVKVEQEKLEMQKANFAKYKEVEEEKIENGFNKLNIEREQLEKEKELTMQTIENNKKEFEIEKEHFAKIKQIEESKLESEKNNLAQNCERFKRLISGLSSNFNNMPNE